MKHHDGNNNVNHSVPRELVAGEIRPERLEHSGTVNNDEFLYAISHASDLDLATRSGTIGPAGEMIWFKFYFGNVHCVHQLRRWADSGSERNRWTCTYANCNNCWGSSCSSYTYIVTVEIESTEPQAKLYPYSDCKYGNTVKMEVGDNSIFVNEIAVIGKQGDTLICRFF